MSSGIDMSFVRETYQKMSDDEITRILCTESQGLTFEALEIVKEEVIRRNLDPRIITSVEVQNKIHTLEEIDSYCNLIQDLPCPHSGSTDQKLNATVTIEVISFLLFTQYKEKIVIGCPRILDKANNNALTISAIFGWWGIPWGIIKTFKAIVGNNKNKWTNHLTTPNDFLRSFVLSKIGEIEIHKDDPEKLKELISLN